MKIEYLIIVFTVSILQGAAIPWGMSSRANGKMSSGKFEQEDTFSHVQIKDSKGDHAEEYLADWFGVFDGHGGPFDDLRTCDRLKDNLHSFFEDTIGPTENRLAWAFQEFDENALKNKYLSNGSTAVVAYIKNGEAHVAHVGDSKAIFFGKQGIFFATNDHDVENQKEMSRIRRIYDSPEKFAHHVHMKGESKHGKGCRSSRVNGLPMARVMGNAQAKKVSKTCPIGDGAIIAVPDYTTFTISDKNQFMILATDGVWGVMTPEDAVGFVNQAMADTVENLQKKYSQTPQVVNKKINLQIRGAIRLILQKTEEEFNKDYAEKRWHEIATENNISTKEIEDKLKWREGELGCLCKEHVFMNMPVTFDLVEELSSSNSDTESYKLKLVARALREEAIKLGSDDNILVCIADLSKQIPITMRQKIYNARYWVSGGIFSFATFFAVWYKFIRQ